MAVLQPRRLTPSLPDETPTAETAAAPTPKYKRLTQAQQLSALQLSKLGKTQTEIAQVLGCDQTSIGRWLAACRDTTVEATAYAKGSALRLTQNVVRKGKPADHLQLLKGIGVLAEQPQQGLNIFIGGNQVDVQISPSPVPSTLRGESLIDP